MTTKSFLNFYASVETVTTQLVKMIVSIFTFSIGEVAPLAAPVAPAFSVFKALSERLNTPFAVALAGAIAIELVGIFISKTAIACHNWNSTRIKTEPEAPRSLAIATAAIFFTVVFILSLTIEIDPDLAILVYPGFVLIAICTYTSLAVSNNLQAWGKERAERIAEQAERRSITADIRQAKMQLELIRSEAKTLTLTVQELATERDQLAADIARRTQRLTRLTKANDPVIAPQNGRLPKVVDQTAAEKIELLHRANTTRQSKIDERHQAIIEIKASEPGIAHPDLTNRLNELGHKASLSTVKRDIRQLNGALT